jgi:polysaccharide pyruvyl transferase WcaK-like protein
VYLVSIAGFPNYGDELITAGWLRELARRAPEADVWVDCPHPGPAAVLLDGLHPRARFVDTLWRLCWAAPSEEPWELAGWVQHAINDPGMAPRWAGGIDVLRAADVLHIVGGGYVHARWPRHVGLLAGTVAAAKLSDARAVMTGQGLVPCSDGVATLLAALADRLDVVDVRDEASGELLRAAGAGAVSVSVDDAFLALGPRLASPQVPPEAPRFMLCLQSDMLAVERASLASMALRTLRAWGVMPDSLGIVEGVPRVDREIYDLLAHELRGARFYPFAEVWRDGLPVAPGQTWLSTRFHPHLMAAAAGANGVAISVNPDYYLAKHSSLLAMGSGWTLAQDLAVPELPTGDGFPAEVVRAGHADKMRIADAVYGPRSEPPVTDSEHSLMPTGRGIRLRFGSRS